jgi:hypothetical protein
LSVPATRTLSGSAIRPVPTANSSTGRHLRVREQLHGRPDHGRIEHPGRVLVIHGREALAEVPLSHEVDVCQHPELRALLLSTTVPFPAPLAAVMVV